MEQKTAKAKISAAKKINCLFGFGQREGLKTYDKYAFPIGVLLQCAKKIGGVAGAGNSA